MYIVYTYRIEKIEQIFPNLIGNICAALWFTFIFAFHVQRYGKKSDVIKTFVVDIIILYVIVDEGGVQYRAIHQTFPAKQAYVTWFIANPVYARMHNDDLMNTFISAYHFSRLNRLSFTQGKNPISMSSILIF